MTSRCFWTFSLLTGQAVLVTEVKLDSKQKYQALPPSVFNRAGVKPRKAKAARGLVNTKSGGNNGGGNKDKGIDYPTNPVTLVKPPDDGVTDKTKAQSPEPMDTNDDAFEKLLDTAPNPPIDDELVSRLNNLRDRPMDIDDPIPKKRKPRKRKPKTPTPPPPRSPTPNETDEDEPVVPTKPPPPTTRVVPNQTMSGMAPEIERPRITMPLTPQLNQMSRMPIEVVSESDSENDELKELQYGRTQTPPPTMNQLAPPQSMLILQQQEELTQAQINNQKLQTLLAAMKQINRQLKSKSAVNTHTLRQNYQKAARDLQRSKNKRKELENKIRELQTKINEPDLDMIANMPEVIAYQTTIERSKETIAKLNTQLQEKQTAHDVAEQTFKTRIDNLTTTVSVKKTELKRVQLSLAKAEERNSTLETEIYKQSKLINDMATKMATLALVTSEQEQRLDEAKKTLEMLQNIEQMSEGYRTRMIELESEIQSLNEHIVQEKSRLERAQFDFETMRSGFQNEIARLEQAIQSAPAPETLKEKELLQEELRTTKQQLQDEVLRLNSMEEANRNLEARLSNNFDELNRLNAKYNALQQNLKDAEQEVVELQNVIETTKTAASNEQMTNVLEKNYNAMDNTLQATAADIEPLIEAETLEPQMQSTLLELKDASSNLLEIVGARSKAGPIKPTKNKNQFNPIKRNTKTNERAIEQPVAPRPETKLQEPEPRKIKHQKPEHRDELKGKRGDRQKIAERMQKESNERRAEKRLEQAEANRKTPEIVTPIETTMEVATKKKFARPENVDSARLLRGNRKEIAKRNQADLEERRREQRDRRRNLTEDPIVVENGKVEIARDKNDTVVVVQPNENEQRQTTQPSQVKPQIGTKLTNTVIPATIARDRLSDEATTQEIDKIADDAEKLHVEALLDQLEVENEEPEEILPDYVSSSDEYESV